MIISASSARDSISIAQSSLATLMALHLTSLDYGQQTCVFDGQAYDYIIVGAGTAGSIVASRLIEDKNITVLLIEAGDDPGINSEYPSLMLFGKTNSTSWPISIQDPGPSQETHTKTNNDMSLGRVLGGSSSFSFLTYIVGGKNDYNAWSKTVNSSIWNWNNVLKYFQKAEDMEDPYLRKAEGEYYGKNGSIKLTAPTTLDLKPYLKMFNQAGNPTVASLNAINNTGYAKAVYTIGDDKRQSSAISYLSRVVNNPNLYILKNAEVIKIVFDACKNAVGVIVNAKTCDNRYIYVKAKIEVILSAGVVNSPKILMLSGIGYKKHLSKHKIHTIADLPVGEGLQFHVGVTVVTNFTNNKVPFRPYNPKRYPASIVIGHEAGGKDQNFDIQTVNYINFPSYLMNYCAFTYNFIDSICNNFMETNVNTIMMYTVINKQKSKTRGRVLLKSNNFLDSPLVYENFYSNQENIEDFAKILSKFLNKLEKTKMFKNMGGEYKDPKLSKCGRFDTKNLDYLKCYIKYMRTSQYQYTSTCAMGSVVDSRLKVYHVQRLRVVDASVMVNTPFGGALAPTIMVAEKAADMIKEDRHKYKKQCKIN